MNSEKKEPWLLTLMKGQVSNASAEALGKGPWWLFVVVILATSILAAFPFINDKFTSALRSTNPALYPGLVQVFEEVKAQGWELSIDKGLLKTGASVPAQARVGSWLVVFEPAGGSAEALKQAMGTSGTTIIKVAFFGISHFGLIDQDTQSQFDGSWEKLGGFRSSDLEKIPPTKMLPILLYASATGGVVASMYGVMALMFVQVVFLTVLLGFLLSLTKVHVAGTMLGAKRGAGFVSSLKTTGFVALGPALFLCLVLAFLPGGSGMSWVGFTLLFGVRIVFLYMARFRNKKKATND